MLNTLCDGFDQICGISEFLSMEENREYAGKKAVIDSKNIHHNYNYPKVYFAYARQPLLLEEQ